MSGDGDNGRGDPGAGLGDVNEAGPLWQGYAGGLDLGDVARAFRAKFGYRPVEVKWAGAVILAGPIGEIPQPEPEPVRSLTARAAAASRAADEVTQAQAAARARQLALQLEV